MSNICAGVGRCQMEVLDALAQLNRVLIASHCIINSSSVIEHDCNLADYFHISPNVSLAGNDSVGKGAHIGIGASII